MASAVVPIASSRTGGDTVAQQERSATHVQLELDEPQNSNAFMNSPDDGRPRLLAMIVTLIDTLYMVFVVLTSEQRPSYAFISSVGGIVLSVLAMIVLPTIVNNVWERCLAKWGLVRLLKVLLCLSTFGIGMSAVAAWMADPSAVLDYLGLLLVVACRPIEPAVTSAVTFSTNKKEFMAQLRYRKLGLYVGGWLAISCTAVVNAGSAAAVMPAIGGLNAAIAFFYLVTYWWMKRAFDNAEQYQREKPPVTNLFEPATNLSNALSDITIRTHFDSQSGVSPLAAYIRYIITNGALTNLAEMTLLALIVNFTGSGKTGDSVLAMFLVALLAVIVLLPHLVTFNPDHRGCMFGGRIGAGVLITAIGIAAPFIATSGMNLPTSEFAWTTLLIVPLLLLTYGGDQPLADVARYTLLTMKSTTTASYDGKFRKTMYVYAFATSSVVEAVVVSGYVAVKHGGGWACFGLLLGIGVLLVISTLTAIRTERHIITQLNAMKQPLPADGAYALNTRWRDYLCCFGSKQMQQLQQQSGARSGSGSGSGNAPIAVKFSLSDIDEEAGSKPVASTATAANSPSKAPKRAATFDDEDEDEEEERRTLDLTDKHKDSETAAVALDAVVKIASLESKAATTAAGDVSGVHVEYIPTTVTS